MRAAVEAQQKEIANGGFEMISVELKVTIKVFGSKEGAPIGGYNAAIAAKQALEEMIDPTQMWKDINSSMVRLEMVDVQPLVACEYAKEPLCST